VFYHSLITAVCIL